MEKPRNHTQRLPATHSVLRWNGEAGSYHALRPLCCLPIVLTNIHYNDRHGAHSAFVIAIRRTTQRAPFDAEAAQGAHTYVLT